MNDILHEMKIANEKALNHANSAPFLSPTRKYIAELEAALNCCKHECQCSNKKPENTLQWDNLSDDEQSVYFDMAVKILQDFLVCTKSWEAWMIGTMNDSDFNLACEDDNVILDTAKMLFEFKNKE